jgi:hypothetical protein
LPKKDDSKPTSATAASVASTRIKASKNFYLDEFWCPCQACREGKSELSIIPSLLVLLQKARDVLGLPIEITCGIRCPSHNKAVRGAPDSRHLPGHADAVDVACSDSGDRFRLVELFVALGVTTVIVYPRHIHIDMRPGEKKLFLGRYC